MFVYNGHKSGTSALRRHTCTVLCGQSKLSFPHKALSAYVKQETTEKCVALCCKDFRLCDFVAGKGFVDIVQHFVNVAAKYGTFHVSDSLPHPTTVSQHIEGKAQALQSSVAMEIKPIIETYGCAITTDIWTEDYHKTSFISSTIHYTNDDFAFVLRVLFAAPFENGVSKTGENIRNLLFQKLRAFGIDTSLLVGHVVFVTDRGANVVAALHGYTRLNCKLCILNVILSCAFAPDLESENSSPSASLALPWSVRHLEHCQAASLEPVLSEVASVCASCLEEVMGTSDTSANPLHMIYRIATFLTPKMRCCAQKQEMTWSKVCNINE